MPLKIFISKDKLKDLYKNQTLNTYQIAERLNCCQATVWKKLKKYRIKRRSPYELNSNVPSKRELIKFYVKNKLSTWKIEKEYGYSRGTVHRKLKEYGIKTRDRAESHIIYPRKDFNKGVVKKAYLIGFRLGDLRVKKPYKGGKTIYVACSSTIPEQIMLIKDLFQDYGRVWISTSAKNIIHTEVHLNDSFDFLLPKSVPLWVFQNKIIFFSFLAGFVDAEGHIGIYNNMARFSIGNYNLKILKLIYKNLIKYGINCNKVFSDKRKGKFNNEGYPYRNNYWNLRINRKKELLKILYQLKHYIKHKNKVKDLNRAIDNINERNKGIFIKK